jgi:hypothetical protein
MKNILFKSLLLSFFIIFSCEEIDNPPTVLITSPVDGEVFAGVKEFIVDASDDIAVIKVDLFIDNVFTGTDDVSP